MVNQRAGGKGFCRTGSIPLVRSMSSPCQLWFVLTWMGDVVHAASLTRGETFSVGTSAQDWPFPEAVLGAKSMLLVDYRSATAKVWVHGGQWLALVPGQRSHFDIGSFRILTTLCDIDDGALNFGRFAFEREAAFCWFASVAAQLALLTALVYSTPALTNVEPSTERGSQVVLIQQDVGQGEGDLRLADEPEGPELLLGIATEELPFAEQVQGDPMRCIGYEAMGRRGAAKGDRRYAIAGRIDNPDPHPSRQSGALKHLSAWEPPSVNKIGITGNAMASDPDAPIAPFGREASLGTDEVSARGNMWGESIGDAAGDDGMLKSSLDGGLLKRIEVVRLDNQTRSRPARVLHSQLSVHGSLSPHDVEVAVASRMAAFRDCYRADSASRSDYEAHLDLGLEIQSTGELTETSALKSERVSPSLLSCILEGAGDLSFPAKAGTSQVSYPLHFIPSREEASPPAEVIALAQVVQRETELPKPCAGTRPRPRASMPTCPR